MPDYILPLLQLSFRPNSLPTLSEYCKSPSWLNCPTSAYSVYCGQSNLIKVKSNHVTLQLTVNSLRAKSSIIIPVYKAPCDLVSLNTNFHLKKLCPCYSLCLEHTSPDICITCSFTFFRSFLAIPHHLEHLGGFSWLSI